MSNDKRSRNPNFTSDEKIALLEIINKYKGIIENKKTDRITTREKESTWLLIENQFNAILPAGTRRTWNALRTFYDNLKKKTRHEAADLKSSVTATGGGPGKTFSDPTLELTLSVMNKKSVFGLKNSFDSDGIDVNCVSHNKNLLDNIITEPESDKIIDTVVSEDGNILLDWGSYKPAYLQSPISSKLKTRFHDSSNNLEVSSNENEATNSVNIEEIINKNPELELQDKEAWMQQNQCQKKDTSTSSTKKLSWVNRRRPANSTNVKDKRSINELYQEIGEMKVVLLQHQAEEMKEKRKREEIEHELRKEALMLDLKIKRAQLENLTKNQ